MDQPVETSVDATQDFVDSPEEVVEPQLVRIKLNGRVVMVTEEVAEAIQSREAAFQSKITEQGIELGVLRQHQQRQVTQQQSDTQSDPDMEFFASPSAVLEQRLQAAEERAFQRMQLFNAQQVAQTAYWSDFYSENPDLVGREPVVKAVLGQEINNIKDLPLEKSRKLLAESVRVMLGDEGTPRRVLSNKQAVSETGGNHPAPKRSQPQVTDKKSSVSSILEQRAAARRAAQFKTKDE